MKRTGLLITLFISTIVLLGCSPTPNADQNTSEATQDKSGQQITVDFLNNDGSITKITTTEAELNGPNGCFMHDGRCLVKSPNPAHNGAYVPEGVDFYPASEGGPTDGQ
jgi:hypothetical protein